MENRGWRIEGGQKSEVESRRSEARRQKTGQEGKDYRVRVWAESAIFQRCEASSCHRIRPGSTALVGGFSGAAWMRKRGRHGGRSGRECKGSVGTVVRTGRCAVAPRRQS